MDWDDIFQQLDDAQFENICAVAFSLEENWEVVKRPAKGPGGPIDLVVRQKILVPASQSKHLNWGIQCKLKRGLRALGLGEVEKKSGSIASALTTYTDPPLHGYLLVTTAPAIAVTLRNALQHLQHPYLGCWLSKSEVIGLFSKHIAYLVDYIPARTVNISKKYSEVFAYLEAIPCERYLIGKFPNSSLRRTLMAKDIAARAYENRRMTETDLTNYISRIQDRRNSLINNMREYANYEIYSSKGLRDFVDEQMVHDPNYKVPKEEVVERIETMCYLLEHPQYKYFVYVCDEDNLPQPTPWCVLKEKSCAIIFYGIFEEVLDHYTKDEEMLRRLLEQAQQLKGVSKKVADSQDFRHWLSQNTTYYSDNEYKGLISKLST